QSQRGTPTPFPTESIADHLHVWAPTAPDLGDTGLVLWTELLRGEDRARETAAAILRRNLKKERV
ncbi:MAG: hypothetical protein F6J89_20240, partial [Symploca sp. SIO1C4]|nr:hypothetical protein [Symploca sp. SIO1C4]